ncbi:MAG: ribosome silencing factor [Muribaculaceae bacterium]|nr:ribosome silencing factor [Muribaculaceae bacterium]
MPNKNNINDLSKLIIEGIQNRKGRNISIVDMTHIEAAPVSRFIIAEGNSNMQVGAIADSVREFVLENGDTKPYNYDGYTNAEWIVVDYGDTLVHIFQPEARIRYNLEDLWSDAVITDIPDLD